MLAPCQNCYAAEIPEGQSNFTVKGALTASATYRWTLTDKFGNRLNGTAATNTSGDITVSDSTLPNLLMNFSGAFTLQFFPGTNLIAAPLTLCNSYQGNCIIFTCFTQTGTPAPAIIGQCS